MKFGVFSPLQWPGDGSRQHVLRDEIGQALEAEAQGYHAVWLAEHPVSRPGIGPSLHLSAAHLAAHTARIRVGTAVRVTPFFHPLRIAEEIATLDRLSNGRIDWAASRGCPGPQDAGFRVESARSRRIFREQLAIVLRAWTGERFSWEGEFYRFPELEVLPTPLQRPHPPLRVAALSRSTLAWAADHGYAVLSDPFAAFHEIEASQRFYFERAARAGRDLEGVELVALRQVYVGATTAKAREEAGPALLGGYRALGRAVSAARHAGEQGGTSCQRRLGVEGLDLERDREGALRHLSENCVIVGDGAYCRDRIQELRERLRLDNLIAWQSFGDLPHEATRASQRRFIEEVAPAFA